MSLSSQFLKGAITVEQFISATAADLHKDLVFFQSIPGVTAIESWALDALQTFLLAKGLSGTLAVQIIDAIKTELVKLAASTGTPTSVVATPAAPAA